MKASKFNLNFVHDGYNIGFNSFSNEYIIFEDLLYEMFDASSRSGSFEELRLCHPEFYDHLVEKKFLVEPGTDEVELVKQASYLIDNDDTKFELHINPTMNCNFKCWYCYETHIKDSKMDEAVILNITNFISRVFEEKPGLQEFNLSFFGGEPLLYFKKVMVPILESAHALAASKNIRFNSGMTTNGLLIDSYVIEICKKYNSNFFQITLDGNRERHNKVRFVSEKKGSYDRIVANIFDLAAAGLTPMVRVNISSETLGGIKDIAADFAPLSPEHRANLRFDLHKVWQVKEDLDPAIQEVRRYFRQQGFHVASHASDTVVHSCYGDHRNHATINYNGEVFKCTARDFTHNNSEGKLTDTGTIDWNIKYEKRLNSKFKNRPCLECRILPLCGGGCSQQALEHEGVDYCVYDFDEDKKVQMIKDRFLEIVEEIE